MNFFFGRNRHNQKTATQATLESFRERLRIVIGFILYCACCLACAYCTRGALGELPLPFLPTVSLAFLLVFLCASRITYFAIILPCTLVLTLWGPVGIAYGEVNVWAICSTFFQSFSDAFAFYRQLPTFAYWQAIAIFVLALAAYLIASFFQLSPWRNKVFVIISIGTIVCLPHPSDFISRLVRASFSNNDITVDLSARIPKSNWSRSTYLGTSNKDYVLIVGESARRDYFHVYGYPLKNTPFLDNVPATFVDGMTSADAHTLESLSRMLTLPENDQARYSLNIIDLAKSAGFETFWITNQGMSGRYDSPVSAIGYRADHWFSFTIGSYSSHRMSDLLLVTPFEQRLNLPAKQQPRLFVLQMAGSHPVACDKLSDMPDAYQTDEKYYEYVACYASTIKKTDRFINRVYDALHQHEVTTGRPFSIIYFSDHGQSHKLKDGIMYINHIATSPWQYQVPLVRIDSNDKKRTFVHSKKSGQHFTQGLAQWMNIKNSRLAPYSLFDGKDDVFTTSLEKHILSITKPNDTAIDLTGHLKNSSNIR